uniref:Caspase family p10 domain-containing protein n=1 Tax=Plectus sambesii TaxID=2011161 RepID=A0A914W5E4_9BILA
KYKSHAADILVLWATGWGFLAWRESSGSFFIQELTNTIKDEKNKGKHLIEMMEEVITAVKNRFSGGTSKAGQCPQFLSSLDRKLCLR